MTKTRRYFLRTGLRAGGFRALARRAAFFWRSPLFLASCLTPLVRPAAQPAAPLLGPGRVLVYNFVAETDEIEPHRGSARNDPG